MSWLEILMVRDGRWMAQDAGTILSMKVIIYSVFDRIMPAVYYFYSQSKSQLIISQALAKFHIQVNPPSKLLFKQKVSKIMDYKQQQNKNYEQEQLPQQTNKEMVSQFTPLYDNLSNSIELDLSRAIQSLERNEICYLPMSTFHQFQYKVEKMLASYGFYRIHVKIAHFSLTLSAAKCLIDIASQLQNSRGTNSNIFFAKVNNRELCLKGYPFKTQAQFQKTFSLIVKELAILKVCSALKCTVNAENFLGFDILIHENMISFATEKGIPITNISIFQARQLREELRLMHEFKIIHFDIKSENIIFSQHYRKAVFIDFGFSDIIKEEIGFRTETHFRGTPNFCTAELLAIMSEPKGYADVYYNDAFGLNLFIGELKNIRITEELQQKEDICLGNQPNQISYGKQIQPALSFLPFKFYYLNGNYPKAKECMMWILSIDDNSIRRILMFMRDIASFARLEKLLLQDLSMYASLPQYKQIKEKMKILKEKFFFEVQEKSPQKNGNHQQSSALLYEPISNFQLQQSKFNFVCYKHHLKLIMAIQQVQEKLIQNIMAVIFGCIRFDVHNLSLQDKIMIAKKMNPLFYHYQQEQYDENVHSQYKRIPENTGIEDIRFLFSQIVYHIFFTRSCKWAKESIFDLFEQMILLDMDCSIYADRLLRYIDQLYLTQEELILACLELKRFSLSSRMLVSQHPQKMGAFLDITCVAISRYQNIFKQMLNQNDSLKRLKKLYDQTVEFETSFGEFKIDDFFSNVRKVTNSKIKDYIHYHIFDQLVSFTVDYGNIEEILRIASMIKTSISIQNLDFLSCTRLNLKLICAVNSYFDIDNYCNYIARVINCQEISNNFKICQIKKRDAPNHISLSSSISYVLQNYEYLSSISEMADNQMLEIILRIKSQEIPIQKDLENLLLLVYKIYEKCMNTKKVGPQTRTGYFWFTFIRSQVEFFFYEFNPSTRASFLDSFCSSKKQLDSMPTLNLENPLKFVYLNFKYLLYEHKRYQYEKRYEECFSSLLKLCSICQNLRINKIAFEMFKQLNHISIFCWNEEMLQRSVTLLFAFCSTINSYSFYLLPTSYNCVFITFLIFAKYSQQQFQQFIICLTQFLTQNPLQTYFYIFLSVLDRFLARHPTRGHLFHYSKFQSHPSFNLSRNPYLLIFYVYSLRNEEDSRKVLLLKTIAVHFDNLNNFARKKLLEKYYYVYLDLVSCNPRKGSFIFRIAKQFCSQSRCKKEIKRYIRLSFSKTLINHQTQLCLKQKRGNYLKNY